MKNQIRILGVVCLLCVLFYRCVNTTDAGALDKDSASVNSNTYAGYSSQSDWGKHLVTTLGCGDCHTPKKMTDRGPVDDSSLLLSGFSGKIPIPELKPDQRAKGVAATFDNTGWTGPWGNSYVANLTPDSTGIGNWTEEQFINCIRKGLYKGLEGSRPLMPPMPAASYRNLTDDELKAVFAYLKTVKPIQNTVPEYQPPALAGK